MCGGLLRGVELEATPAVSIDNAFVEPLFDRKKARLHVTLRNATSAAPDMPYTLQVNVATVAGNRSAGETSTDVAVGAGATSEVTMDVSLDPFGPWSPESPFLYKAEVVLRQGNRAIDGWIERFGMKKYEVHGGDLYVNNVRYFLRGCGDDYVYPITVCSPASRAEHAKHLRMMKQYGFNYIRLHTHCEIPEYFEAADEVGMMVQAELPYYGRFNEQRPYSHLSGAPLMAKDDLVELVTHMRRYTSLSTYCGGNEGESPTPLDRQLYQMAKSLDPSRPWLNMDGGVNNTRENSAVNHGGYGWEYAPRQEHAWPFVRHEYMSFGINEDPRLEAKYTGAYAQPEASGREDLRDRANRTRLEVGGRLFRRRPSPPGDLAQNRHRGGTRRSVSRWFQLLADGRPFPQHSMWRARYVLGEEIQHPGILSPVQCADGDPCPDGKSKTTRTTRPESGDRDLHRGRRAGRGLGRVAFSIATLEKCHTGVAARGRRENAGQRPDRED